MIRNIIRQPGDSAAVETVAQLPVPDCRTLARRDGLAVFLTGLPAAGKTTVAMALHAMLLSTGRRDLVLLDGDTIRETLQPRLGFSRRDRAAQMDRLTSLALEAVRRGGVAICAAVAPHDAARRKARLAIESAGNFFLVYIATPLRVCEARDPKGLYAKARLGIVPLFTGVSDAYEVPSDAHVTIDTSTTTPQLAAARIISELSSIGPAR